MIHLIFIIAFSLILVLFFLSILFSIILMKKTYLKRGDGSISIRYPLPSDLKNAEIKHGYIKTKGNKNLFYNTYKKVNSKPKALILVIHGIGAGHYYLIPLIQKFIDDDYMVIAYDQYASGCSEGKTFVTMTRGIIDIKYVLNFIKGNELLNKMPLYIFGHSWGGYVAGCSLLYSNSIEKIVDVSGFDNECDFVPKFKFLIKMRNLFVAGFKSFKRVQSIFEKTTAKVYYLQGEQDLVVNPKFTAKTYQNRFKNKTNIVVELLQNKGHTPFNDDKSQKEQNKVMGNFGMLGGKLVPIDLYVDFRKISIIDENIYSKIRNFYES